MKNKVLIIGLDGATFSLLGPWIKQGRLPNFKKLVENGSSGILKSTIPPVTAPAWTSFATGLHPRHTGIFDFLRQNVDYSYDIVSQKDLKKKSMWDLLSFHNMSSILMNVPMTYPPKPIQGIIIPGMLTPRDGLITFPDSERENLLQEIPRYIVEPDLMKLKNKSRQKIVDEVLGMTRHRRDAMFHYLEKEWDLFVVVYRGSDILQHLLWDDKDLLLTYYQYIDRILQDVFQKMDNETSLIVMSDHGFSDLDYIFHMNQWLATKGLLKRKQTIAHQGTSYVEVKHQNSSSLLGELFLPFGLTKEKLRKTMKGSTSLFKKIIPQSIRDQLPETKYGIDWEGTKAYLYSSTSAGIKLHVRGRDPKGTLGHDEYVFLKKKIMEELRLLKDPLTGNRLFQKVMDKEELCNNTLHYDIPDIFIESKNVVLDGKFSSTILSRDRRGLGMHHPDGIFLAYGNKIKKGKKFNAEIVDIAPSVLHILGLAHKETMDGRIIEEILQ